jgi:hypothetical protein
VGIGRRISDVGDPGVVELLCRECSKKFLRSKAAPFQSPESDCICFGCWIEHLLGAECDRVIFHDPKSHKAPVHERGERYQVIGRSSVSARWFCLTFTGLVVEHAADSRWEYL